MTRDEAIEIDFKFSRDCPTWDGESDGDLRRASMAAIDSYVALGMIKLDEPKGAEDELIQQLIDRGFSKRNTIVVREALDYANLKIVEK